MALRELNSLEMSKRILSGTLKTGKHTDGTFSVLGMTGILHTQSINCLADQLG